MCSQLELNLGETMSPNRNALQLVGSSSCVQMVEVTVKTRTIKWRSIKINFRSPLTLANGR